MIRSIFAGVSGMRAHQAKMDVIGNNIANVNTTGFKSGRASFVDQLSQAVSGAAAPAGGRGGANARQVGLGVALGAIDTVMTQGNLQPTGKPTDLAIEGNGFFVLSGGGGETFTRAGAFDFDRDGTLVDPGSGLKVMGWSPTPGPDGLPAIDTTKPLSAIQIPLGAVVPPKATTSATMRGNLDERVPLGGTVDSGAVIHDALGNRHVVTYRYTHEAAGKWSWNVVQDADMAGAPAVAPGPDGAELNFDANGLLAGTGSGAYNAGAVTLTWNLPDGGTSTATVTPNFGTIGGTAGVTQFADDTTVVAAVQDGHAQGELTGVAVDKSGTVTGTFSNGMRQALGQVAIATFSNPGGLTKTGGNGYNATSNSGEATYRVAGAADAGSIASGTLEMSNVDLAQQFSDMIITQRGLQASSRVISASDEVLQELLNLKR